jgi:hypothetical protein
MHKINRINITRVLQKIWFENGISRADLSRELGLVKSTVTNIVSQLLERRIVKTTSEGKSVTPIGRKPSNLISMKASVASWAWRSRPSPSPPRPSICTPQPPYPQRAGLHGRQQHRPLLPGERG